MKLFGRTISYTLFLFPECSWVLTPPPPTTPHHHHTHRFNPGQFSLMKYCSQDKLRKNKCSSAALIRVYELSSDITLRYSMHTQSKNILQMKSQIGKIFQYSIDLSKRRSFTKRFFTIYSKIGSYDLINLTQQSMDKV